MLAGGRGWEGELLVAALGLRQPMEASLRAQLFGSTNRLEQLTSEAFEIYQPLVAEKACLACHNEWKEGQIGGVELIRLSNAELRHAQSEWAASETRMRRDQWVGGIATCVGLLLAVVILVSGLLRWLLTRPLLRITKGLDAVSQGDVSNDVDAALRARKDEIGHLAQSIQAMTESLRRLLRNVADGVQTLASSASGLSTISNRTTANVRGVSDRATTVAEAATASSAHAASVASSMEEAAANLCSVAGATEQMSSTVNEIASHSEKARVIGDQAMHQAQSVSSLMQELGSAAQAIGKVTETITDISAQTNLLALNATIEAARAGAAGKGFAVVASEIKALAHQTATATEDIKAKITGVQTTSSNVVADIGRITTVIKDVGQIVSTIAAAIEEQATVTKDLAGNVAHASTGVSDANQRVAQAADAARSMAVDISGINTAVADLRQGGEQVQARSAELSGLAEQLKAQVDRFKLTGPASAAVLVDSIAGSQPEARLHRAASAA